MTLNASFEELFAFDTPLHASFFRVWGCAVLGFSLNRSQSGPEMEEKMKSVYAFAALAVLLFAHPAKADHCSLEDAPNGYQWVCYGDYYVTQTSEPDWTLYEPGTVVFVRMDYYFTGYTGGWNPGAWYAKYSNDSSTTTPFSGNEQVVMVVDDYHHLVPA